VLAFFNDCMIYGVCRTFAIIVANHIRTVCANTFERAYYKHTVERKIKLHVLNTHVHCLNTLYIALSNNNMASI
jgi:hypothetical protein